MKKITAFLLCLLALCSLAACAGENSPGSSTLSSSLNTNPSSSKVPSEPVSSAVNGSAPTLEPSPTAAPTSGPASEPDNGTHVLVAYFSATGNTRPLAEYMADGLGADLYEIVPEEPYTEADLNYNDNDSRTTIEMNDPNSRPAINGSVENMEQYDIVFIGYPIWWGDAPHILYTFMESYDWNGKTVIPFCTSGGSGIGSSGTNLESLTTGATWISGQRLNTGASRDEVMEWVSSLGLDLAEGS